MKFVFAGNRAHVLARMLERQLEVASVFALEDSYLQSWLTERAYPYEILPDRAELADRLEAMDFDCFVSCGCPRILPITRLKQDGSKMFVNIHPSLLPDLRGVDPVPGTILFDRPAGVTCHHMDDGIDTGPPIAQVPIERGPEIDVDLLYRMSFRAEAAAFCMALERNFAIDTVLLARQRSTPGSYYTFKPEDAVLSLDDDLPTAHRRLQAFATRSKGVTMSFDDGTVTRAFGATILINPSLLEVYSAIDVNTVAEAWDETVLLKKPGGLLRVRVRGNIPRAGARLR